MVSRASPIDDARGGALLEGMMAASLLGVILTIMLQVTWIEWAESVARHAVGRAVRTAVVALPLRGGVVPMARGMVEASARHALAPLGQRVARRAKLSLHCGPRIRGWSLPMCRQTSQVTAELTVELPLRVPIARRLLGGAGEGGGRVHRFTVEASLNNEGIPRYPQRR